MRVLAVLAVVVALFTSPLTTAVRAQIPAPDDVAAPPKDAKKTKSGIAYKVLKPGRGDEHPTATSEVRVHYTGWTTDGKMFDTSLNGGLPAELIGRAHV